MREYKVYQFWSRRGNNPWVSTEITADSVESVLRWAAENNVEIENVWRKRKPKGVVEAKK